MTKILFICHGNICRSPMAEFVMKDLVRKAGLEKSFYIESAATSREELGNPVYPPARRKLAEHGISCQGENSPAAHPGGLPVLRFAGGYGLGQSAEYGAHLRRRPPGQAPPAAGLHRPPRPSCRPLVHRGLRRHLAGCAGRLPRAAGPAGPVTPGFSHSGSRLHSTGRCGIIGVAPGRGATDK